jgi:hypothetical protein
VFIFVRSKRNVRVKTDLSEHVTKRTTCNYFRFLISLITECKENNIRIDNKLSQSVVNFKYLGYKSINLLFSCMDV